MCPLQHPSDYHPRAGCVVPQNEILENRIRNMQKKNVGKAVPFQFVDSSVLMTFQRRNLRNFTTYVWFSEETSLYLLLIVLLVFGMMEKTFLMAYR
jgi:hypothetical protein